MFYIIDKNDELALFSDSKETIENTLIFKPELNNRYILEADFITAKEFQLHPNKVIIDDIEIEIDVPDEEGTHKETITVKGLVLNPDYDKEEAEKREIQFKEKFFKVGNYGYYRRQPKGYQSAVESMNVLFNIANVTKGLQAGLIIFYQEPDFTDAEQCTEEWLIQHQIIMPAMTLEEFLQLYVVFMTAWNTEEHEKVEGEDDNTTDTTE
jgi:hypothetical protein